MPNTSLKGRQFKVPKKYQKALGGKEVISYENLNKIKSEKKVDDDTYQWVVSYLKQLSDAILKEKKVRELAGEKNVFKKEHHKDKDNTNPTKPTRVETKTNTTVFGNLKEEIEKIKYLNIYINKDIL